MGHFVYKKSKWESFVDIVQTAYSTSLANKIYFLFFLFMLLSIIIGTSLTGQRQSVDNFAAERTVEAGERETTVEKILKYIQTYILPLENK